MCTSGEQRPALPSRASASSPRCSALPARLPAHPPCRWWLRIWRAGASALTWLVAFDSCGLAEPAVVPPACRYGVFSSQEDEEVDVGEQPQWAMELASAANAAGVVSGASAKGPGKLPPPGGAGGHLQPFPVYDSSSSGSSGGSSSDEDSDEEQRAPGADSGEVLAGRQAAVSRCSCLRGAHAMPGRTGLLHVAA
jgi:hypothetical protein